MTLKLNTVDEAGGEGAKVTAVLSIEARISEGSAVDQIEVVRSNMTKCFRVVAAKGLDQCSCVDPELLIIKGRNARGLKSQRVEVPLVLELFGPEGQSESDPGDPHTESGLFLRPVGKNHWSDQQFQKTQDQLRQQHSLFEGLGEQQERGRGQATALLQSRSSAQPSPVSCWICLTS